MNSFKLSTHIDPNKVFLVNLSEVEGIYSPLFYESNPKKLSWNIKLKDIAIINPAREKPIFNDDDLVPYVGLPETDEYTRKVINVVLRPYKEVKGRNVIYPNDILFARIEPSVFNKKYIFVDDLKGYDFAFTSTEFYIIEENNVDNKYIFNLLFSDYVYSQIKGKTTGSTGRRRLDLTAFKNIEIPKIDNIDKVINLYEQVFTQKQQKESEAKKLLSSIDDYLLNELGIELAEKDNSLKNRIFTTSLSKVNGGRFDPDYYSLYYQQLENEIAKSNFNLSEIDSVVSVVSGGKTPASKDYSEEKTNFPIIKVGSYSGEFIDLNKVDYTFSKNSLTSLKGDIFILSAAHQAEYVGRHIKYLDEEPKIETSYVGELICIRTTKTKCNSMFLFSLLNTEIYKTLINREKTGQTSHIYGKDIKHIKIPLPKIGKQTEIANHISDIRTKAKQLEQEAEEILEKAKQEVEQMILGAK